MAEGIRAAKAHRVAWFLETGSWPNPCGLHRCDNTLCVRFSHLFEGTQRKNNADKASKGRAPFGENAPRAKLTETEVLLILEGLRVGYSPNELGDVYGVTGAAIRAIRNGRNWKRTAKPVEERNGTPHSV